MKKILATILCAALLLSLTVSALAETSFSFSTTATSGYPAWCEAAQSNGKNWHFDFRGELCKFLVGVFFFVNEIPSV